MRRKLKENRGKMKKSEASIIKRHQSISLEPFCQFSFGIGFREENSTKRRKQAKEGQGKQRKDKESK